MGRVLVVDDEPLVCDTLKVMLEHDGYDVVLARTGREGIEKFRSQRFDLVICDIFMPELSGLEAISEIRGCSAEVPIIAMSGGFADAPEQRFNSDLFRIARHNGATLTLAKPFRRAELTKLLQRCLMARVPLSLAYFFGLSFPLSLVITSAIFWARFVENISPTSFDAIGRRTVALHGSPARCAPASLVAAPPL